MESEMFKEFLFYGSAIIYGTFVGLVFALAILH
jgi:hypothetical protein